MIFYLPIRQPVLRERFYERGSPGSRKRINELGTGYKEKREKERFFDTGGGYKALCKYAQRDVSLNVSSVNHKRMYSICKENNLLLHKKQKRKEQAIEPMRTGSSQPLISYGNLILSMDIFYGKEEPVRFFSSVLFWMFLRKILQAII